MNIFQLSFPRDLKPENILIKADWHIMLCDFGSVKLLDKDMNVYSIPSKSSSTQHSNGPPQLGSHNMYRTKSFVGTAQFVSPEILTGKPASFGSDLWGLGCIIFQLLTGKWPFHGEYVHLFFIFLIYFYIF